MYYFSSLFVNYPTKKQQQQKSVCLSFLPSRELESIKISIYCYMIDTDALKCVQNFQITDDSSHKT